MPKSDELGRRLASLEDGVQKEQRSNFIEIGKLLTEILDKSLYAAKGYRSFVKYVDDDTVFKFTGKHAVRLVRTYRFIESLPVGVSVPTSERQVRPLIKLGFDEAREVWMEAQKEARREGKPVTGELVADLVGRFQRNSFGRAWTRSGKGSRASPVLRSSLPNSEDSHPSSFRSVLLMAEFEQLRAKVHGLTLWEKEKLLDEWRRSLDGDLSVLRSEEGTVSPRGSRKRCQGELWSGSNNDSSSNCELSASDSSTIIADELPGFARKKKRTGLRKPRSNMNTLVVHTLIEHPTRNEQNLLNAAVGTVCQPNPRLTCRNGERSDEQQKDEVSRQGLGLLWSAVQIVSK